MAEPRARRLVGRERALEQAVAALRPGRGVLVTSRRGLGRTAFAEALAATADGRGDLGVVWATATESLSAVAFGVFGALVGDRGTRRDPAAVIGRIASELRSAGGAGGTLLVIDDAHLLDDSSADAVVQALASRSVVAGADRSRGLPASGEPREAVPGRVPHPHRPRRAVAAGHGRRRGGRVGRAGRPGDDRAVVELDAGRSGGAGLDHRARRRRRNVPDSRRPVVVGRRSPRARRRRARRTRRGVSRRRQFARRRPRCRCARGAGRHRAHRTRRRPRAARRAGTGRTRRDA